MPAASSAGATTGGASSATARAANYLTTPVDVTGLTSGVQAISAGGDHTCALLTDGSARCWGLNNYGQAGNNTSGNAWLGPVHVCASGSGFGCTGGTPLTDIARISAGGLHTCAVTTGGALKCWGSNYNGQLGLHEAPTSPPTTAECTTGLSIGCRALPTDVPGLSLLVTDVSTGGAETCAVVAGGVMCWGYNAFGQVGNGTNSTTSPNYPEPTPQNVTGLFSGVETVTAGNATCALTITGGVKCWGLNDVGQLGDGTTTQRTTPVDVVSLGAGVAAIGGGSRHNCAVTDAGGAKCWGANDYGQLGNGETTGQFEANPMPSDVLFGVCSVQGFVFDGNLATDTHQNPIKGAKVELLWDGGVQRTTVSGADGSYSFNCAAAGDYQVRATLQDGEAATPVYEIRYLDSATEAVWVQRDVTVDPGDPTVNENVVFADVFATQPGDSNVPAADRGRLDDMGNIFYRTRQYVGWISGTVGANLSSATRPLPVEFYVFSDETDGAFYRGSETLVKLSVEDSLYTSRDVENDGSPENGEWHEFGHHIYQANISDKPYAGTNHNGYRNPDTSDSLSEATPEFLSLIAWHDIVGGIGRQVRRLRPDGAERVEGLVIGPTTSSERSWRSWASSTTSTTPTPTPSTRRSSSVTAAAT